MVWVNGLQQRLLMGVKIKLTNNTAVLKGSPELTATSLTGGDLRSCAAMVLISLFAKGTSIIKGLNFLDRGYELIKSYIKSSITPV